MLKKLKLITLSTTIMAVAVATAACSSGTSTGNGSGTGTGTGTGSTEAAKETAKPANTKKLEVSIGIWDADKAFEKKDSDEMLAKFQKDFNLTFVPKNVGWSDYKEKFKLWGASGELPDIMAIDMFNTGTYNQWIDQGLVRALPDDLSKYPNIDKLMKQPDIQPLKRNGKFYMIPRQSFKTVDDWALERGIVVRKDWMQKLGISTPQTFEDYKQMFKAFAEKDPDGNNKKDTVGVTVRLPDTPFLGSSPAYNNEGWLFEKGQWIPGFASEGMVDGLNQMRQLYTEGALDPDFAILKNSDAEEKFAQNKAGAVFGQISVNKLHMYRELWNKYNNSVKFEDAVAILPVWKHKDGNTYRFVQNSFWSESYFSAKVDDEKMDRILKMYDFLLSEEAHKLVVYGFEGKDYKMEGGKLVVTRPKDEKTGAFQGLNVNYPSSMLFSILTKWREGLYLERDVKVAMFGETVTKLTEDAFNDLQKNAKPIPTKFEIKLMSTPGKDKVMGIKVSDDITKVILSKDDVAQAWQKVLDGYNAKGLKDAIKEVNENAAKLGIKP